MKKIILILLLAIGISIPGAGQNITLSHSANAFIVNGIYYPLNSVILNIRAFDTSLVELDYAYENELNGVIASVRKRVKYIDARTGLPFVSIGRLIQFYDSFAVNQAGGGQSLYIGATVNGSALNRPLLVDAGGLLAQYADVPWVAKADSNVDGGYISYSVFVPAFVDAISALVRYDDSGVVYPTQYGLDTFKAELPHNYHVTASGNGSATSFTFTLPAGKAIISVNSESTVATVQSFSQSGTTLTVRTTAAPANGSDNILLKLYY